MLSVLNELGLDLAAARNRDFDSQRHWAAELSLADEQTLSVARALLARPRFAFLDHLDSSLNDDEFRNVRRVMARHGIACIVLGNGKTSTQGYDAVLELYSDGSWKWTGPAADA
jgi:putative ATP-binding cassette transporter